ncbi:MAG: DUF374 domain-containing protein [Lentisphaeria bacterium]|nr:DUF374 domain-containing protein [Lentisphaeria bacterium]
MAKERKRKRFNPFVYFTRSPGWVAWVFTVLVRLIVRTCRFEIKDPAGVLKMECWPVVCATWHNRIVFLGAFVPPPTRRASTVLVSKSRDGEYAAEFARKLGLSVARGSSSRGGVGGALGLQRAAEAGQTILMTVDGPRGPKYSVKPGAIQLAVRHGMPIVPFMFNAPHRWELKSWDNTQFPKPFSRVEVIVGDPLYIEDSEESTRETVREALLAITDDARA